MRIVNIDEAKTRFFKLMDAAVHGNKILIAMVGKPVVKLGPIYKPEPRLGVLKGKIKIAKDFDTPLSNEFLTGFEA